MDNEKILRDLRGGLIVSCQALENEPLHGSDIMARMAYAAYLGGAAGIRANTPEDIRAIKALVNIPVIGIIKSDYTDSSVYITPTMYEIEKLVAEDVEIIAIDATRRIRPAGETLAELFSKAKEKYPNQLFMADCSDYQEAINASALGFDIIATTMCGYTSYTQGTKLPALELAQQLVDSIDKPVIVEGGISTPEDLKKALMTGAYAAVVGSAITRPMEITKRFAGAIADYSKKEVMVEPDIDELADSIISQLAGEISADL